MSRPASHSASHTANPSGRRAVFLDFDGTLAFMHPPHLTRYVEAAAASGVAVTEEQLRAALDAGWARWQTPLGIDHATASQSAEGFEAVRRELHVARYRAAGATGDLEGAARRLVEIERDPAAYTLYSDTLPALAAIRAAGLTAVIVSNHIWELPAIASALGLDLYIEAVLTSARIGYRKPHPRIFEAALALIPGIAPGEVLFVGDSATADVEGPRAAGMRAVLLRREATEGTLPPNVICTLADLPLGSGQ